MVSGGWTGRWEGGWVWWVVRLGCGCFKSVWWGSPGLGCWSPGTFGIRGVGMGRRFYEVCT